ncbi:MAG: hypothetical protein HY721_07970, partial [Planctomycetes bacterium]|nr:hypothetical protein [Planctomycetota bacterium]
VPGTALVLNLHSPTYCQTVYGGNDPKQIARRFSELDPSAPASLMKRWNRERLSTNIPRKLEKLQDLPQQLARFIAVASEQLPEQG